MFGIRISIPYPILCVLYNVTKMAELKEGHLAVKSCHFLQYCDIVGLTGGADTMIVKEKAEPIGIL